jgi:hypothetical protein
MAAWNGWYHVNGNTYGTWLPGDPRGWRTKRHRRHVEGDYKHPPPPGTDRPLHQFNRQSLRQPPVHLTPRHRQIAGQSLVEMLLHQSIETIVLCVTAAHFHLLGRFRDGQVRPPVGRAKKHACFVLKDGGLAGRLWTSKDKVTPIRDREHQVNVFNYICGHQAEGGWLWTFRDGIYWPSTIRKKGQEDPPDAVRGL